MSESRPTTATEFEAWLNVSSFLRRRWLWFAATCAAGLALGFLYASQATKLYRSSAQILVMQRDTRLTAQGTAVLTAALDERSAENLLATHMQIISSRKIVQDALEQNDLASIESLEPAIAQGIDSVAFLLDKLEVTWGGKGLAHAAQVINVALTLTDPEDSARVLQAIIEGYEEFIHGQFQDAGLQAGTLIETAMNDLAADLKLAEEAYLTFREANATLLAEDRGLNVHQVRLQEIERSIETHRIRYAQVAARAEIVEQTLGTDDGPFTDLERMASISSADIQRLTFLVDVERWDPDAEAVRSIQSKEFEQLMDARMEHAKLVLELGPENPRLLASEQMVQALEQYIEEKRVDLGPTVGVQPVVLMTAYLQLLQHDIAEISGQLQELESLAEVSRTAIKGLVAAELREDSLRREMERTQVLYDSVVQRLQEINLLKDYGVVLTQEISPVNRGEQVWPRLTVVMGSGGMLGLLFGVALALLLEIQNRKFRTVKDVRTSLQLDLLGVAPDLKPAHSMRKWRKKTPGERGVSPLLAAFHQPSSKAAESFRQLSMSILFNDSVRGVKVIQVASPRTGEGNSLLLANLAVSIAKTNRNVLIIDADLRRPTLHDIFDINADTGLTNYLAGETQSSSDVMTQVLYDNLFVLPAGSPVSNSSELLSLPRFEELIRATKEAFDVVLIDSPPLLTVTDPLMVSARVDSVILQVRVSRDGRETAQQARAKLNQVGARVAGVVVRGGLDGVEESRSNYG